MKDCFCFLEALTMISKLFIENENDDLFLFEESFQNERRQRQLELRQS